MRGQTVLLEHVLLTSGTFLIFVAVVISFAAINQYFVLRRTNDALLMMAEQASVGIVTAYEHGKELNASQEPVVKIYLDFPADISGRPYDIYYDEQTRTVVAVCGESSGRADLLGIPDRTQIEGKISASSADAYVSYYRSSNTIVLGVEWR